MKIILSEYDPQWPTLFEQEKAVLLSIIGLLNPTIEHIGSTSVPGLIAKPIIDIIAGLPDFGHADKLVPKIQELGYTYLSRYEDEMPYRRFFKKLEGNVATHHIHMVEINSDFWIRHLLFRDYLRGNPTIALEYADLKRNLAQKEWEDSNDYADAKGYFIRGIEQQAGFQRS